MSKIILASNSPRRKQLLEWAEVDFEIQVSEVEETYPPNLQSEEIPVYIAEKKALAVLQKRNDSALIIAADTMVFLDDHILGKPFHREDAISMLLALSGSTHKVITGVVMVRGNDILRFADVTEVCFHQLTIEQIEYYVDKYQPYDKAGGYAIQEWIGVVGIQSIAGDFYNVMGLPVSRVVQALKEFDKLSG